MKKPILTAIVISLLAIGAGKQVKKIILAPVVLLGLGLPIRIALILPLIFASVAEDTLAGLISWEFAGIMDDNGDVFSGIVSFDDSVPDTNTSLQSGEYRFVDLSQADLILDLNGDLIFASETHADGRVPDFIAEVELRDDVDMRGDLLRFIFNVQISPEPTIPGLQEFILELFFIDESGMSLTVDALPTEPFDGFLDPSIDGWGDFFSLVSPAALRLKTFTSGADDPIRDGTITSASVSGTVSVPEPTTLALFATGLAGLGFMMRRRGRRAGMRGGLV